MKQMEKIKNLLEVRKKIKSVKPTFIVKEANFSARVKRRWRFPRGKHSSTRQYHKGRPKLVNQGYGSPKAVRFLPWSGKKAVRVSNVQELLSLDSREQSAVISKVGRKKMLELLQLAKEKKIEVLNVKDIDKLMGEIKSKFAARKKLRDEKTKEKTKKQEEKKKKAEEKEKKKKEEDKEERKEKKGEEPSRAKEDEQKEKQEEQKKVVEKTIIKKQ